MKTPLQLKKAERKAEEEVSYKQRMNRKKRVIESIESLVNSGIARGTITSNGGMIEYYTPYRDDASDVPIILNYFRKRRWDVTYKQATETSTEWSMTTKSEYTSTVSLYVFFLKPKK